MKNNSSIYNKSKALRKTDVSSSGGFEQELQNDYGASDYDMMMIFGTSASEQRQYLKDNPKVLKEIDKKVRDKLKAAEV